MMTDEHKNLIGLERDALAAELEYEIEWYVNDNCIE